MPLVDDIIQTRLIAEQQGIAMSTSLYWKIDDVGNNPSIQGAMQSLAFNFVESFRTQLSDKWRLTCVLYRNITRPQDAGIPTYVDEAGSEDTLPPHPTNNVVRVTRYAATAILPVRIVRSSIAISGLHVGVSRTGRVEQQMELGVLEEFLNNVATFPAGGWQAAPVIPHRRTVLQPLPIDYAQVRTVITQGTFVKLRRRSTALCGSL
jgi:hypothetical protein